MGAHRLDPGPKRGEGTWDEFLKRHAQTLWACDFFSKKVWTLGGLVDVFVLFVIPVSTRRAHIAGVTAHPDRVWVAQQARSLATFFDGQPERPHHLLRDRDTKFVAAFDEILAEEGVEVKPVSVRAPNMNAGAERFVQSVKTECLDHFVAFGEDHLRHLLSEYVDYYHRQRPHQALGNRPLSAASPAETAETFSPAAVGCEERLGGLLRHYYRKAG